MSFTIRFCFRLTGTIPTGNVGFRRLITINKTWTDNHQKSANTEWQPSLPDSKLRRHLSIFPRILNHSYNTSMWYVKWFRYIDMTNLWNIDVPGIRSTSKVFIEVHGGKYRQCAWIILYARHWGKSEKWSYSALASVVIHMKCFKMPKYPF